MECAPARNSAQPQPLRPSPFFKSVEECSQWFSISKKKNNDSNTLIIGKHFWTKSVEMERKLHFMAKFKNFVVQLIHRCILDCFLCHNLNQFSIHIYSFPD